MIQIQTTCNMRPATRNLTLVVFLVLGLTTHAIGQTAPPPTLRFFIEDEIIDLGGSVTTTQLPLLQLKVVPDSIFAAEHPYDVKYAVVWTAFVKRGMNLGVPQKGNTSALYGPVTSTANKGDVIQVEVDRIIRTDSAGRTEKVVLDKGLKYLTIPVK